MVELLRKIETISKYFMQGLRHWRKQNEKKIDRSDVGKKEVSLGTQLGRRMTDLVILMRLDQSADCWI